MSLSNRYANMQENTCYITGALAFMQEKTLKTQSRAVDVLLMHLKTQGACSTRTLAQVLGVSFEAVRQQLTKLIEQGIVVAEVMDRNASHSSVGRPKQRWKLTATGHARFPDTHAQLTVQIIRTVEALFGHEGMRHIVERHSEEQLAYYRTQLHAYATLADRLTSLARLRDEEGYMARIERHGADFLLIEDHCPICAAATACQGFCVAELTQFQTLMQGLAQVTREEHLLHGARRCVYRFSPATACNSIQV